MSEVEYIATPLFPQLVFCRREPNALWTKPEFIKHCLGFDYRKNGSNWASLETYVLDLPEFKELKDTIQDQLDLTLKELYKTDPEKVQLYITQSWLVVNKSGDSHNQHNHPNSILSGVAYLSTGDEDGITFLDRGFNTRISFQAVPTESVPVKSGDILVFDSQLQHLVSATERKHKRVSLAFNTFIKGTMGSNRELTEVKIYGNN